MTLGQLCRAVSDITSLSDAAGTGDRAFLDRVANRAVLEVLHDTDVVVAAYTLTVPQGTSEVEFPTDILRIIEYEIQGNDNRLSMTLEPAADVLSLRRHGYQGGAVRFALLGANLLLIQPTSETSRDFTFYVVPAPTVDLEADDDDPAVTALIPAWAHRAIECWMLKEAMTKNHSYDGADYWQREYDREVVKIRNRSWRHAGRRAPGSRVGYPGGPSGRNDHDNSSYP